MDVKCKCGGILEGPDPMSGGFKCNKCGTITFEIVYATPQDGSEKDATNLG